MRSSSFVTRAFLLAFLTLVAIAIHEAGHFVVYRAADIPVRITLQSVHAVGQIPRGLDHWALVAGPLVSCLAAGVCLLMTRKYPGFFWASAAFTNASLRLFPMAMDIARAARAGNPFSDEGTVVLAATSVPALRLLLLGSIAIVYLALTVSAARTYHFANRSALRAFGIYAFTVAIGIGIVIADELLSR